jgi:hypothetical protein
VTPRIGSALDQSNTNGRFRDRATRPDHVGNGKLTNPIPKAWFDVTAFPATPKGAGHFGNSGVGVLEGTIAITGGLFKNFSVAEKLKMRIEDTFTNLPNHPNFALNPFQLFVDRPGFAQITSVQDQENSGNRVGQVGVRLDW